MSNRIWLAPPLAGALVILWLSSIPAPACCPAGKYRKGDRVGVMPVVNADQSIIMIWDAATKTQHFIRKASFKSEGDDFAFLVPTPTRPKLAESGNEAFPYLYDLTKPKVIRKKAKSGGGFSCAIGCSKGKGGRDLDDKAKLADVKVLEEIPWVAGFKAVVLETKSASALVNWLKVNEYAFSPEVEAWAKPYVEAGWMIVALKVAKAKENKQNKAVGADALRLTFKTDQPLFPYREPDSKSPAQALGAHKRLLRIYFLAEARYTGSDENWTRDVKWANKIAPEHRKKTLELLKLPGDTGPAQWWLTEFEHNWPYEMAKGDVYFSKDANQSTLERKPIIEYVAAPWPVDASGYAIAAVVVLPPLFRRFRARRKV